MEIDTAGCRAYDRNFIVGDVTLNHSELHLIDLLIIGAYLITMVSVGVYCVRRVKTTGDYYVAGRSLGPMVLMATVCATIIGGSGLMGRAGVAYSSGTKAILTAVPYLLGMFLFADYSGRISDIGREYGITSSRTCLSAASARRQS